MLFEFRSFLLLTNAYSCQNNTPAGYFLASRTHIYTNNYTFGSLVSDKYAKKIDTFL